MPMDGSQFRGLLKSDYFYPSHALTSTSPTFNTDDIQTIDDCNLMTTSLEKLTACTADVSLNENVLPADETSVRESKFHNIGNISNNDRSLELTWAVNGSNDNERDINNETCDLVGNVSSESKPALVPRDPDNDNVCDALTCSKEQETLSKADNYADVRGMISTSCVQTRPKNVHDNQTLNDSQGVRATESHNGLYRRGDGQQQLHAESEPKPRDRSMSLPDVKLYEQQFLRQQNVGRALRHMSDEFYYSQLAQVRRTFTEHPRTCPFRIGIDLYSYLDVYQCVSNSN